MEDPSHHWMPSPVAPQSRNQSITRCPRKNLSSKPLWNEQISLNSSLRPRSRREQYRLHKRHRSRMSNSWPLKRCSRRRLPNNRLDWWRTSRVRTTTGTINLMTRLHWLIFSSLCELWVRHRSKWSIWGYHRPILKGSKTLIALSKIKAIEFAHLAPSLKCF